MGITRQSDSTPNMRKRIQGAQMTLENEHTHNDELRFNAINIGS